MKNSEKTQINGRNFAKRSSFLRKNNDDPWFKGLFDEHIISQAIHDLYDHTEWAFQDILKINYLDSHLIVEYEHEENIK